MAGLESLVQKKVNAFRGNPGQLEQSYQLNQQLVDLLALQKIKTDKEAAARDIQLKMAQQMGTPPTIKQQRETELLDNTRQEIAQQVGATGQQQAAEQQARMQALVGNGGIASFAEGGSIRRTGDPIADNILESQGKLDPSGIRFTMPEWLRRAIEKGKEANARARQMRTPPITEESDSRQPPAGIETIDVTGHPPTIPDMEMIDVQVPEELMDITDVIGPVRNRIQDSDFTVPAIPENEQLNNAINNRLDSNFAANRGAEERGVASEYLGIPAAVQDQRRSYQDQLSALDARQMDPRKLARQRLAAFLIAAGRGHNLGSGLGLGGSASMNLQGEQETAERSRLMERQGVADKIAEMDAQSRAGIYGAGANAQNAVQNQVSTAINAAADMRRSQMDAQQKAADRAQEAQLEQARIAATKEVEALRRGASSKDRAVQAYAALQANYDQRLATITETARMFQLPPEQVQAEIELLESQYGDLLEQLRTELSGNSEGIEGDDSAFTVRRVE